MAVSLAPQVLVNCVAPGLLEGTRATANLLPEQIEKSAAGSLLKKAADKDDCAAMTVAMCRTDTMTGQTVVIDVMSTPGWTSIVPMKSGWFSTVLWRRAVTEAAERCLARCAEARTFTQGAASRPRGKCPSGGV